MSAEVNPLLTGEGGRAPQRSPGEVRSPLFFIALAAVALPRLLAMPFAQDFYGDAVVRGELAARFAAHPHLLGSFAQGSFQFGPLQLYVLGALDMLGIARDASGRWSSLLFGILTAWPLWALTRRYFGERAALLACLGLSIWGMHVQFSTTGGSESMATFFFCATLAAFARAVELDHEPTLLGAALLATLGSAVRYDLWLLIPFLGAAWLWKRGLKSWKPALLFCALASAFPFAWLYGNWVDMGDPFYVMKYIEDFHRNWFPDGDKQWGVLQYRLQNLFFWPGAALATLTPGVAVLGTIGLIRSWRAKPEARWLIALAVLPALWLTARSTLFGTFVPLARFTAKELLLLLVFVGPGAGWLAEKLPKVALRSVAAVTALLAVALPLWLAVFTYERDGKWESTLKPISPLTTQPRDVSLAVDWLRPKLGDGACLAIDSDAQEYHDLLIAFRSGLPEERLARFRWDTFWQRFSEEQPRYLLRFERGELERGPLKVDGETAQLGGTTFTEVVRFGSVHIYAR
ncbi:MAG: glycosyltransferase family 39 protein [Myxococcaceae bacterium]